MKSSCINNEFVSEKYPIIFKTLRLNGVLSVKFIFSPYTYPKTGNHFSGVRSIE